MNKKVEGKYTDKLYSDYYNLPNSAAEVVNQRIYDPDDDFDFDMVDSIQYSPDDFGGLYPEDVYEDIQSELELLIGNLEQKYNSYIEPGNIIELVDEFVDILTYEIVLNS